MLQAPVIYLFHPYTRQFMGLAVADANLLEPGRWLLPGNATLTKPPDAPGGKVALYATNHWVIVPADSVPEWRN